MNTQSNGSPTAASCRRLARNYLRNAAALIAEVAAGPHPENQDRLRRVWWALRSAATAIESSEDSWHRDHDPRRLIQDAMLAVRTAEHEVVHQSARIAIAAAAVGLASAAYPGRKHRTS